MSELLLLLHGPLRDAAGRSVLRLERVAGETAGGLKRRAAAALGAAGPLALASAVADGERIYAEGEAVPGGRLELLPPVSGG